MGAGLCWPAPAHSFGAPAEAPACQAGRPSRGTHCSSLDHIHCTYQSTHNNQEATLAPAQAEGVAAGARLVELPACPALPALLCSARPPTHLSSAGV